jgi:membrane-associated protease RseP (regulator of RpoE activity)
MEPAQTYLENPEAPVLTEPYYLPPRAAPRQRVWLHVLLYLLTIASTIAVAGPIFSAGLLSILTAHEFGHYFTARRYGVPVSLPYFIPFPFSLFGTLGAVIRMSPRIPNRRALFDIAAAGPIAGLVLALPLSYIGILHSSIVQKASLPADTISLGEPLLFQGLEWLAHGSLASNLDIVLHPLAFAGWAGMFVTALNLLPIGQLDGGHITHSLFGSRSRLVAGAMYIGLALYSIAKHNVTWLPLLLLLLLMGVQHPPSMDDGYPLGRSRLAIGILLGMVFLTCFSLVPIKF